MHALELPVYGFMMSLGDLSISGVAGAGLIMGISFGPYWANRDFLELLPTNNSNRNYYYELETFFATNITIVGPMGIGGLYRGRRLKRLVWQCGQYRLPNRYQVCCFIDHHHFGVYSPE